jgi:predicted ribosome quality control (RQC) complex YloA/Tae2 family protein
MRHELSALELLMLAKELNAVKGYYIDQFYQLGEMRFRIKLSSKGGKANLNIEIPNYVALSDTGEIREEATGFAMAVRKRLSGSRISGIGLLGRDRILDISFERKDAKGRMIIEMFGRGNLIITDERMEILLALQTHEFTDRKIRKGEVYKPPRNESVDLDDKEEVAKVFASLEGAPPGDRLAAYLSRKLGIGNLYLEDAIVGEGLDPKIKIKDLKPGNADGIRDRILSIVGGRGGAILYLKDGKPEDVAVAEIRKYSGLEKREMPLNQAVELFYSSRPREALEKNEDVERIEASLKRQEEIIGQMHREEAESRKKGDFISARVAQIGGLIKAAADKRVSEGELKAAAEDFRVKRIDRAKRVIIIEADDAK